VSVNSSSRTGGKPDPDRRRGAAQRSVILGIAVCALALLGLWLIVGRTAPPPERAIDEPIAEAAIDEPVVEEEAAPSLPPPAPDATITLASGQASAPLIAASFAPDAVLNVDLALPISIVGSDPLWARVLTAEREPLVLDGLVRGADRNSVRLEVPAAWLVPGRYLIEIKTPEQTHLPLRRFAFVVE